jgi:hypothetical protein
MNLVHHALHDLHEGVVLRGVDNKTRAVAGDGQKVGMDFAANSGGDFAPSFRAKQLAPDSHLLYFDFDPKLVKGRSGGG